MSTFSGIPLEMWFLLPPFFSSTSRTLRVWVRALSGSTLASLSVEKLEVKELPEHPLLAFVSTGNKGGNPVVKWTRVQLSLVLL